MNYISMIHFFLAALIVISCAPITSADANQKPKSLLSIDIKAYEAAFEMGDVEAAHWLGTFYYDGVVVEKNVTVAAGYFSVAAHAGVVGSMFYLAELHLLGLGVHKDCGLAERWLTRAYGEEFDLKESDWASKICDCKSSLGSN